MGVGGGIVRRTELHLITAEKDLSIPKISLKKQCFSFVFRFEKSKQQKITNTSRTLTLKKKYAAAALPKPYRELVCFGSRVPATH